jgi:hypothetical protein
MCPRKHVPTPWDLAARIIHVLALTLGVILAVQAPVLSTAEAVPSSSPSKRRRSSINKA